MNIHIYIYVVIELFLGYATLGGLYGNINCNTWYCRHTGTICNGIVGAIEREVISDPLIQTHLLKLVMSWKKEWWKTGSMMLIQKLMICCCVLIVWTCEIMGEAKLWMACLIACHNCNLSCYKSERPFNSKEQKKVGSDVLARK